MSEWVDHLVSYQDIQWNQWFLGEKGKSYYHTCDLWFWLILSVKFKWNEIFTTNTLSDAVTSMQSGTTLVFWSLNRSRTHTISPLHQHHFNLSRTIFFVWNSTPINIVTAALPRFEKSKRKPKRCRSGCEIIICNNLKWYQK